MTFRAKLRNTRLQREIERRAGDDEAMYRILLCAASFRNRGEQGLNAYDGFVAGVDMYAIGANATHDWLAGCDENFVYIARDGEDSWEDDSPISHTYVKRIPKGESWGYVGHF